MKKLLMSVTLLIAGVASAQNLSIDAVANGDRSTFSSSISTSSFSTSAGNELLLAFVCADSRGTPNTTVTSVSGGGLSWQRVQRANTQLGTAEIWRAFAASLLGGARVTANLSQSVAASITVVTFTGVDTSGVNGAGAIGASASTGAPSGAPSLSLTTTRNNSWVIGVGNDWDNPISRTLGPNQTLVHQFMPAVGDT